LPAPSPYCSGRIEPVKMLYTQIYDLVQPVVKQKSALQISTEEENMEKSPNRKPSLVDEKN
jgi:hypothetical protein